MSKGTAFRWGTAQKRPINVKYREVIPNYIDGDTYESIELIETREGKLRGYPDKDFIIMGIEGEIYPISKTIFHKSYKVLKPVTITDVVDLKVTLEKNGDLE